jgi:hypothetical protein
MPETVVLLHGIWMTGLEIQPLAAQAVCRFLATDCFDARDVTV